jgi:hypothetical protein
MARLEDGIQVQEGLASKAISGLAEEIQELCYMLDAQNVPPATVKVLHRAYRVLKPVTDITLGRIRRCTGMRQNSDSGRKESNDRALRTSLQYRHHGESANHGEQRQI